MCMSSLEPFRFRVLESAWRAWLPVKILSRCLRVHYPESSRNFPDKFYFRFYARWLPSLPGWCGLDARMMAAWSSSSEELGASCRAAKLFHILKLPSSPLLLLGLPQYRTLYSHWHVDLEYFTLSLRILTNGEKSQEICLPTFYWPRKNVRKYFKSSTIITLLFTRNNGQLPLHKSGIKL